MVSTLPEVELQKQNKTKFRITTIGHAGSWPNTEEQNFWRECARESVQEQESVLQVKASARSTSTMLFTQTANDRLKRRSNVLY